jgi:hypothetical protein
VTPQQHIEEAERSLTQAISSRVEGLHNVKMAMLLTACAHALIALAVENGVPHAPTVAEGS